MQAGWKITCAALFILMLASDTVTGCNSLDAGTPLACDPEPEIMTTADGHYTYLQAFDREFLNVVKLISAGQPVDDQELIRRTELEKHHLLTYAAGSTVNILHNPAGERFIGVSRSADRTSDTFTLPEGWTLTSHVVSAELPVELSGNVSVLRTDNEDSFQGPISDDISF